MWVWRMLRIAAATGFVAFVVTATLWFTAWWEDRNDSEILRRDSWDRD